MRAVTELFGPEQARVAAEDWVDELEFVDILPEPAGRDWRSVTIAAAARLAKRLNVDADRRTPRDCRLVYGVASLPLGAPVELEVIFELAG